MSQQYAQYGQYPQQPYAAAPAYDYGPVQGVPPGPSDPYASQGYGAYPGAPPQASTAPPAPAAYADVDYNTQHYQQPASPSASYGGYAYQGSAGGYGGYDAVSYPTIPTYDSRPPPRREPSPPRRRSPSPPRVQVAAKPQEASGAAAGSSRYKCMLLPTEDGADIENVVAQVGLDGILLMASSDNRTVKNFSLDSISRWSLADPTILTMHTKTSASAAEGLLSLSSDEATTRAIMDTLVTSAFQWCELRGYDPAETIEEKGGTAGKAGEWVNNKAGAAAAASASAASTEVSRYWESPDYSGWLTKKGEHLSTWRKRWFVLKDRKLVWFKSNDVTERSKPRGTIELAACQAVVAAQKASAGRANALELCSIQAEKAGAKYLVADSERERDAWVQAIDKSIKGESGSAAAASAGSAAGLASQLQQGFQALSVSGGGGGGGSSRPSNPDVNISLTEYTPGQRSSGSEDYGRDYRGSGYGGNSGGGGYGSSSGMGYNGAGSDYLSYGGGAASISGSPYATAPPSAPAPPHSAPSQWQTYYTNEGIPYYVNSATGVTQWEPPR